MRFENLRCMVLKLLQFALQLLVCLFGLKMKAKPVKIKDESAEE